MNKPLVSIVMPVFNREDTVAETVESVLRQTWPNWELIVVDDGSADRSAEVIQSFDDSRIRVLRLPHTGNIAHVRNMGLGQVNGRYVAHLDSDDLWHERKTEIQMACFGSNRMVKLVLCGGEQFGEDADAMPLSESFVGDLFRRLVFRQQYYLITASVMVDMGPGPVREFFNEALNSLSEVDYFLRMAQAGMGAYIGERLVRCRKHAGNVHKTFDDASVVTEMLAMYRGLCDDGLLTRGECARLSKRLSRGYSR